jgi:hypothetical protein
MAAQEAGRRAAQTGIKGAIATSLQLTDAKLRSEFLVGAAQVTARAETLKIAKEQRKEIQELLTEDYKREFEGSGAESWLSLWPGTMSASYLRDASRSAPVLGARDPNAFLDEWVKRAESEQRDSIEVAIGPLLRTDSRVISRIIEHLPGNSATTAERIFEAWRKYDPISAIDWITSRRFDREVNISGMWTFQGADQRAAIDLINRHEEIARNRLEIPAAISLVSCFVAMHHSPEEFVAELLRIVDPSIRKTALMVFGNKWGRHNGQAALDFAQKIPNTADRENWLRGVTFELIYVNPNLAAAALEGRTDYKTEDRSFLLESLRQMRAANCAHLPSCRSDSPGSKVGKL